MKKLLYFCLISINIFASTSEVHKGYLASMFDEYDKPFEQCLKEHNQAFDDLEKNKSRVRTHQWTEHLGNQIIYHYDYQCVDAQMVGIVNKYIAAQGALERKMYGHALGDGFIIGALVALCNKLMHGSAVKSTSGFAVCCFPLIHILVQNVRKKEVPYFDILLNKQDNKYASLSFNTIGRTICATGAAWMSLLSNSLILHKITN